MSWTLGGLSYIKALWTKCVYDNMHSWVILSSYFYCCIFNRFQYVTTYISVTKRGNAFYSQNHRFRLQGISQEHIVQALCSSRVSYSRLPRTMSNWVSSISTDGELHNPSGQDLQKCILQLPPSIHPSSCHHSIHRIYRQLTLSPFLLPCQVSIPPSSPSPDLKTQDLPKVRQRWGVPIRAATSSAWPQMCGRAQHVHVSSPHRGPSTSYGCCVKSKCSLYASTVYMQKCYA